MSVPVASDPTIFVVDDSPRHLRNLTSILEDQGYQVRGFGSALEALQAAIQQQPALFLLDVCMPELDGYALCAELKKDEMLKRVPVIFISGLTDATDKVKGFSAGGIDYITKPFQADEVRARVATHIRMHNLQAALEDNRRELEARVQAQVLEISASQLATIRALSVLAESRDDTTGRHILRIQTFCRCLAESLARIPSYTERVDDAFIQTIYHASPLHDVGKVGIPDRILLKPGPLDPEERAIMNTHVQIGARTLEVALTEYPGNALLKMGIDIARHHHERWDGSGYPDGLAGEAIPLSARVMSVADCYDAIRSKRPYKAASSHAETCEMLLSGPLRSFFDPAVLEAFRLCEGTFEAEYERLTCPEDAEAESDEEEARRAG